MHEGTPHRREDGELVGWIFPHQDAWRGVDLLGRDVLASEDWLAIEAALEARGIGYLAGIWTYEDPDTGPVRVRMVEVTPTRIVVSTDNFGAIDVPTRSFVFPWPLPASVRPWRAGDPEIDGS